METNRQYCTFYLDEFLCGVEVEKVQEVIRYMEMTPVPLSPPVVSGLINLRGQIVTAMELRRRLELDERPAGKLPMNVVVRGREGAVSLLVDDTGDVLEVDAAAFERPPETLTGRGRELIRGAYKLAGALLLILDLDKTLKWAERTNS